MNSPSGAAAPAGRAGGGETPAFNRPSPGPWRRRLRWAMIVVWAAFIFYLSTAGFGPSFTEWLLIQILTLLRLTVSPQTFDILHLCLRKLAHLTEYAIFCMLIYAGQLETRDFEWRPRLALRSILIAGVYSLTDEYHQSFVMGRTPSIVDCGIDTGGAALGTLMVRLWDGVLRTVTGRRQAAGAPAA